MHFDFITPAVGRGQPVLEYLADLGHFPVHEQPTKPKDFHIFRCMLPGHVDTRPSFTVSADGRQWTCWVCGHQLQGVKKLRELLGGSAVMAPPRPAPKPKKTREYVDKPLQGASLRKLSEAKNGALPVQHLHNMGWRDTRYCGVEAIRINYGPGVTRFRVGITGDRFRWQKGSAPTLYGLDQLELIKAVGKVLLVEGETDAAAARLMGIPALGVPGASNWKPEWAELLDGLDVLIWQEPDQGGNTLIPEVGRDVDGLRVIQAPPGVKDLCELLDQAGSPETAREIFEELAAEAAVYERPVVVAETPRPKVVPTGMWGHLRGVFGQPGDTPRPKKREPVRILDKTLTESPMALGKLASKDLWYQCLERFPDAPGVEPFMLNATVSDRSTGGFTSHIYQNTWKNPSNAQNNRRKMCYNLTPRITGHMVCGGTWYARSFPSTSWGQKFRDKLRLAINDAGGTYIAIDNSYEDGSIQCLATVALDNLWVEIDPDFDAVFDLVSGYLDGIWPTIDLGEKPSHPHYIWGHAELAQGLNKSPDADHDKADLIGVLRTSGRGAPTDAQIAKFIADSGGEASYGSAVWLAQRSGSLRFRNVTPLLLAQMIVHFGGTLTKKGREILALSGAGAIAA